MHRNTDTDNDTPHELPLWQQLEQTAAEMGRHGLADVARFISFGRGERYGPHSHLRIEINYVRRGRCRLHAEGRAADFRKGEMMIIASGVPHTFEAGPGGATLMQLEFQPEVIARLRPGGADGLPWPVLARDRTPVMRIADNPRVEQCIHRIVYEMNAKAPAFRQLVVMYYAELVVLVCRYINEMYAAADGNRLLAKAVGYIRAHYDAPLSMKEVARQTGIGDRHLRGLFAEHLGMSPLAFLNRTRIGKAAEMLEHTDLSIKEISFSCGFRSPQYFSRLFRQYTGKSPYEATPLGQARNVRKKH